MKRHTITPLLFGLSLAVAHAASAATFTVTSTSSVGPGTLYQALQDAAASSGPHAIRFNLPADSRIDMLHSLPPIVSNELDIDGIDAPGLIVDGGGLVRLFLVGAPNRIFRLANIEIRRGLHVRIGGCLLAQNPSSPADASVTLDRVIMRDCEVRRAANDQWVAGGAVHVDRRDLTVVDSRFFGNRALTLDAGAATIAAGGAIAVELGPQHLARIEDSEFSENRVTGAAVAGVGCCRAQGAAVDAIGSGVLSLTRNRFISNYADTLDQSSTWGDVIKSTASTTMTGNLLFGNDNTGAMIYIDPIVAAGSFFRATNNSLVANSGDVGAALSILGVEDTIIRNNTFLGWYGASFPIPHLRILPPGSTATATAVLSHNVFGPAESRWPDPTAPICYIHPEVDASHHSNVLPGTGERCGPMLDPALVDLRIEALRDNGGSIESVSFLQGSPVLDGGNALPPLGADPTRCQTVDARSRPRPRDGDGDGVAICDIGAWEADGDAPLFRHDFEGVLWRP